MLQELPELAKQLCNEQIIVKSYALSACDLHQIQQQNRQDFPFLIESVAVAESINDLSRYSILFAYPQEFNRLDSLADDAEFQEKFEQSYQQHHTQIHSELPFTGGWFAYFSYEYAQVVEPRLNLAQSALPIAILARVPCAFIYDNVKKQLHLVAESKFKHCLDKMEACLGDPPGHFLARNHSLNVITEENQDKYLLGIAKIKEYILSGDIFQVNLSRQWQIELAEGQAQSVYASLRQTNPAPFAANVYFDDFQIISSSPERLVKYDAKTGWVETRPIAGTRKRSDCKKEDKALVEELINHPKEIAEHVMLIDLERNDLGRICEIGTVEVNELMSVETYQHVHHIVSNIRGKLKRGLTPLNVIHAVFPGGTITGCPKIRCMEIIAELEKMPRDVYTGSIGYINRDGSMDTNILIRTMMVENNTLTFRAGAGIVADSVAEKELEEARHKAKGLIQSLSNAE